MSPARDPDTGRFVSGGGAGSATAFIRTDRLEGRTMYEIPAADLSGGTTEELFDGESVCETIDFGELLDEDEVFEVLYGTFAAWLNVHTTLTSESYAEVDMVMGPDISVTGSGANASPAFFDSGGKVDLSSGSGIVDGKNDTRRYDKPIWQTHMTAEGSALDTANNLHGGSDQDRDRRSIPFGALYGQGPLYDADDELFTVGEVRVDNISDGAVHWGIWAGLRGVVHELD